MSKLKLVVVGVTAVVAVTAIFLFLSADRVIPLGKIIAKVAEPIIVDPNADAPPQKPLANPPKIIKAIYATNWSASSEKKILYFLDLLNTTELNTIVLDIKDYTGIVGYESEVPAVKEYDASEKRIPKINALIKRFHDAGVYVIGRIAVFQDDALAKARPDWAVKSRASGGVWSDYKKVVWLDTGATPVWDYNIDIAREAIGRGFDEINFDYIRFPTDGDLTDVVYPFSGPNLNRRSILSQFFRHLRSQLPYARISADIFGEAIVNNTETLIGQFFEDTLEPFEAVAPMIYPSHFHKNFIGLANSATEPYPVIRYAMDRALDRVRGYREKLLNSDVGSSTLILPALSEIRPWLQDFNLGATYDARMVRAQITAVDDSARAVANCPGIEVSSKNHSVLNEADQVRQPCDYQPIGWMLWNASNNYTRGALLPE